MCAVLSDLVNPGDGEKKRATLLDVERPHESCKDWMLCTRRLSKMRGAIMQSRGNQSIIKQNEEAEDRRWEVL